MNRWLQLALATCLACQALMAHGASETMDALDGIEKQVEALFAQGQLAQVAEIIEDDWRSETRLVDGRWREDITRTYAARAMNQRWHSEDEWNEGLRQLKAVAGQRPSAWLLVASAQHVRAWQLRGHAYAREVPADAMAAYRQWCLRAVATLDEHRAELISYATWYDDRLNLAMETGESRDFQRKLFVEGLVQFPRYHRLYFTRTRDLLPKWGGSEGQVLDLLDDIARSTDPRILSEGLYARVLWFAEGERLPLQWDPRINDKALRASIDALVAAYPAQWNIQRMFLFSCQRGDKEHARQMLPLLTDPPEEVMLGANLSVYQNCRQWADGKRTEVVMGYEQGGLPKIVIVH